MMTCQHCSQKICQSFRDDWHVQIIDATPPAFPFLLNLLQYTCSIMSSANEVYGDLAGVGARVRENSSSDDESKINSDDDGAAGAGAGNDVRGGRGGADGIIPANAMCITATHPQMDVKLFEQIVVCNDDALSEEEKSLDDNAILQLQVKDTRLLCKRCKYKALTNRGSLTEKTISTSGNSKAVAGRLLAYFQVLRQQSCLGAAGRRPLSLSPSVWSVSEDARLMEIFLDKSYEGATQYAFVPSRRPVLDATSGSPLVAVWANVIAPLFNNFDRYRPVHRFNNENEIVLVTCNPNSADIPRRLGEHLRSRFATLKSRFSVVYCHWLESGGNDPEKFSEYINITAPLDVSIYYMFRVLHNTGNDVLLHRCCRTLPKNVGVDSGNVDAMVARLSGQEQSATTHTSTTNPTRSTRPRAALLDLSNDLKKTMGLLEKEQEQEEKEERAVLLSTLMSNRDRAAAVMEEFGDKVRDCERGSHKRKRFLRMYKQRKKEWLLLEKQVSEHTKTPFDENDFDDDDSLMDED
jgi:hypothetical protein